MPEDLRPTATLARSPAWTCRRQASSPRRSPMDRPKHAARERWPVFQARKACYRAATLTGEQAARVGMPSTARPVQDLSAHSSPALLSAPTSTSLKRSEEHTSELQSLMRISYAVFCLKKKNNQQQTSYTRITNIQ